MGVESVVPSEKVNVKVLSGLMVTPVTPKPEPEPEEPEEPEPEPAWSRAICSESRTR
jgi:hypothetical protein